MPSIELPSNIGFGVVVGRFLQTVADGADADQNPEAVPMAGSVFFTPSVSVLVNRSALPVPVTLSSTPIEAKIDFEGYLTDMVGRRGVTLIATDDPDNNPTNWTYTVSFRLTTGTVPNFSIAVPGGQTIDLSTVLPVPSSPGIGVPQATAAANAAQAAAEEALRIVKEGGGGGGGTGDHGELQGLADDDHPQYLNNTRGDARYYTRTAADSAISTASVADRNRANHTGTQSADTLTDGTTNRLYTTTEKNKLAGILPGATVNSSDAQLRDRTTHTGTQTSTTIADFVEAVQDVVGSMFSGGNITATYNDTTGTIAITAPTGTGNAADPELIRDTIGAAVIGVGPISVVVNDAADTITISTTATQNSTDAQLRDRSTHTGTQAISTVSGLQPRLGRPLGPIAIGVQVYAGDVGENAGHRYRAKIDHVPAAPLPTFTSSAGDTTWWAYVSPVPGGSAAVPVPAGAKLAAIIDYDSVSGSSTRPSFDGALIILGGPVQEPAAMSSWMLDLDMRLVEGA